MLKALVTIPHYYKPSRKGGHGSLESNPRSRIKALTACVTALHQFLGLRQAIMQIGQRLVVPANQANCANVDIVICTTRGDHLLSALQAHSTLFSHHPVDTEPKLLGFACHELLRENIGDYDYYCYLEDDLIIHDPCFLQKLSWFTESFGDHCLLQPNRFELGPRARWQKLYVDGDLAPSATARFLVGNRETVLRAEVLGCKLEFRSPLNPHSGCFFLNRPQMAAWSRQPHFLDRDTSFIGPLESAATLGILRTFHIYKPSAANANFLEIHHFGTRFLSAIDRLAKPLASKDFGRIVSLRNSR